MRVLVIPSWYPSPDAPTAGVFIRQQVRALTEMADVAVLYVELGTTSWPPSVADEDGATVIRTGIAATGLWARYFGYRRAGLTAFDALSDTWGTPDIVHVQALWPAALIAREIKRRLGIPYVVTEHSEEYLAASRRRLVRTPGFLPLMLRPLAHGASAHIAVSRFLADRLATLGLAQRPLVIPNVVPECQPLPLPSTPAHTIAHVSIMSPAKNLDLLLEAVDRLRERRSDFMLKLVGDGECRADLQRDRQARGLEGVVEFVGMLSEDDIREVFAESAFTVISSTHETFSVVAAESLMCGRPVLSTQCGGPEEFITPDVGRLVAVGSVDAMVAGLDWMLDHASEFDPTSLHEYSRARFAPPVVAGRILDVYRSVLDA